MRHTTDTRPHTQETTDLQTFVIQPEFSVFSHRIGSVTFEQVEQVHYVVKYWCQYPTPNVRQVIQVEQPQLRQFKLLKQFVDCCRYPTLRSLL